MANRITHAEWKAIRRALGLPPDGQTARRVSRARARVAEALGYDPTAPAAGAAPRPGPWRVEIPGWHPPSLNTLLDGVAKKIRAKKNARKWVGDFCCLLNRVPAALGRRRVRLHLVYPPGAPRLDPDNAYKAVLDALKWHGLLRDDCDEWCAPERPTFGDGPARATVITIEDIDTAAPAVGGGDADAQGQ